MQWHATQNEAAPIFWNERRSDSTVAVILTIKHFHPENVRSFRQELKACFKHIKALEADDEVRFAGLILDLRGNSGGHIAIMAELLPYLTTAPVNLPAGVQIKASEEAKARWGTGRFGLIGGKSYLKNLQVLKSTLSKIEGDSIAYIPFDRSIEPRKRLAYSGTTALLLDGLSASATVSIASWFVRSGRGETFGEPPMGSVSGTFGNPVRLSTSVPKHRLVTCPKPDWSSTSRPRGIYPETARCGGKPVLCLSTIRSPQTQLTSRKTRIPYLKAPLTG